MPRHYGKKGMSKSKSYKASSKKPAKASGKGMYPAKPQLKKKK